MRDRSCQGNTLGPLSMLGSFLFVLSSADVIFLWNLRDLSHRAQSLQPPSESSLF